MNYQDLETHTLHGPWMHNQDGREGALAERAPPLDILRLKNTPHGPPIPREPKLYDYRIVPAGLRGVKERWRRTCSEAPQSTRRKSFLKPLAPFCALRSANVFGNPVPPDRVDGMAPERLRIRPRDEICRTERRACPRNVRFPGAAFHRFFISIAYTVARGAGTRSNPLSSSQGMSVKRHTP